MHRAEILHYVYVHSIALADSGRSKRRKRSQLITPANWMNEDEGILGDDALTNSLVLGLCFEALRAPALARASLLLRTRSQISDSNALVVIDKVLSAYVVYVYGQHRILT